MHAVASLAGQVGERGEILQTREPFRLEPPHLARGSGSFVNRSIANDPSKSSFSAAPADSPVGSAILVSLHQQ